MLGNVLGTVGRLDSLPIAGLLGTIGARRSRSRRLMIFALAFIGPFLGLVAALPLQVSATLLGVHARHDDRDDAATAVAARPTGPHHRRRRARPGRRVGAVERSLSATASSSPNPMLGGRDRADARWRRRRTLG